MQELDTLIRAIQDQRLSRAHLTVLVAIQKGDRTPPTQETSFLIRELRELGYLPADGLSHGQ